MNEIKILVFKLGNEFYATNIMEVERILGFQEPTKLPDSPTFLDGVIDYENSVLPIINIVDKFGLKDINSFEELWEYMNKRNDEGVIYINELDIVGHDRTDRDGKFIYDYGNGESKEISENVISLLYLFRKKYKDKL